jgi:hypothetical protein
MTNTNKKAILIFLLFASLIPISLSISSIITDNLGSEPINTDANNSPNYWKLTPNDEIIWILNDTQYYKDKFVSAYYGYLQSKIADISDLSTDADNISDLAIENNLLFGLDSANFPISIYNPIDILSKTLFPIFLNFVLSMNPNKTEYLNLDAQRLGSNNLDTYNALIPAPQLPLDYLSSSFWENLNHTLEYMFNKQDDYFWNYEIFEDLMNSPLLPNYYGIYQNYSQAFGNEINLKHMPKERNFSLGLEMTNNNSIISSDNTESIITVSHILGNLNSTDSVYQDFGSSFWGNFDFNFFLSQNSSLLLSFTKENILSMNPSSFVNDNQSFFLLLENNTIYYLEKSYFTGYTRDELPSLDWNYHIIENFNAGNWTKLFGEEMVWDKLTVAEQWNKLFLQYGRIPNSNNNASLTLKIDEDSSHQRLIFLQYVDNDSNAIPNEFIPQYVNFQIVKSNGTFQTCIDDWLKTSDMNEVPMGLLESPQMFTSSINNPFYWLSIIEPSLLTIFPNDECFNVTAFLKNLFSMIPSEAEDLGLNLLITENDSEFGFMIDQDFLNNAYNLIVNETEMNGTELRTYFGRATWNLTFILDKEVNLLKRINFHIHQLDLQTERFISIELKKTKTDGKIILGYGFWDKPFYDNTKQYLFMNQTFRSRLFDDKYSDILQLSDYPSNIILTINQMIGDVSPSDIFSSLLAENPVELSLILGGIILTTVIPSLLVWKRIRKNQP